MRPTRWPTVVGLLLGLGVLGWVFAELAWDDLAELPAYAPATAVVIAAFELGLARVVHRKVRGTVPVGKPMHPLQVARAAALAKASSAAGAMLAGFYGGFLVWLLPRTEKAAAGRDAWVSAWSALACLVLLGAALLLERACRTPPEPD